jgi:hypothetical protein
MSSNEQIKQYLTVMNKLEHGEEVVVSDDFMDWADVNGYSDDICTIKNPDRGGILDAYVAWIQDSTP